MSEIRTLGLESIEIGDVAGDGGMGTTLAELGVTYRDTAELVQEDAESTEHFSEEFDEPVETIDTKGPTTVKWSIIDCTPATLAEVLGGEVTGSGATAKWEAPSTAENIEKSIKITPKVGMPISIPRAKINAKINYKLARTGILLVEITAKVLTPKKENTASIIIGPLPA